MSLQDESFPDDGFLDELINAINPRLQFYPSPSKALQKQELKPTSNSVSTNTSSSSTEQNLSTESSNGRPPSGMSGKTTQSDPSGLGDHASKKSDYEANHHYKAMSYQDIASRHSEYTKRRYKHVESKVGQYIASMKAEDQKRRNPTKFQRHRSMPETPVTNALASNTNNGLQQRSAADLHKMIEFMSDVDCSENATSTTGACSRDVPETSNDAGVVASTTNQPAFMQLMDEKERIESFNEYLQSKLDEKMGEIVRLKRNVDYMRIELSDCKDKLKKQHAARPLDPRLEHSRDLYARHSLPSLIYSTVKISKATQTDLILQPLNSITQKHDMFALSNSSDANNNIFEIGNSGINGKMAQCVATIQPISLNYNHNGESNSTNIILRQRTNSNSATQTVNNGSSTLVHNSSEQHSCPSSSNDSAIDIETIELPSPRAIRGPTRQIHREEFIYYDKRSGRCATLETLNASNGTDESEDRTLSISNNRCGRKTARQQQSSFCKRWLRIFGSCTRCREQAPTTDSNTSDIQHNFTQVPLLTGNMSANCSSVR